LSAATDKKENLSLFIPYNIVKKLIQSAADIASQDVQNSVITDPARYVHVQRDADFADYSINLGYSYRFKLGKKMTLIMPKQLLLKI
jgi:hypothetical protein